MVTFVGESGPVGVSFLWAVGYNVMAICDCAAFGDLRFWDKENGICTQGCCIALGKATKFVGKMACPHLHMFGLFDEVTIFICNSSVIISDECSYGSEWQCWW